ncbi:MBL fold metallo-hydrolase [Nocardioides sp. BP30]|uniref:MBL fold metallo-hydrolase n=1 Tax=Nocardioides sp. BP30 TaxID=3036374 RepID=UPI0024682920|nr:MBL fold metallo-hydrolase [Nocardioides sp. BP30]WGL52940.1 MBL fold metallo-hydrolase [Nocardioides sp. BP30]
MRITKFGHACVRIEHEGTVIVLDPGVFTDREALDGADAILITHEHPDHYLPDHLASVDAPVWTIDAVAAKIREDAPEVFERTTVVAPGESFQTGGVPVSAVGELHAVIHPELPRFHNSGYLFTLGEQTVFHPGDALLAPPADVDVLLAPASAPWARSSELVDFMREVKAPVNIAIHDRIYSAAGHQVFDGLAATFLTPQGQEFKRLDDGQDL